jgi:hypothetical protein
LRDVAKRGLIYVDDGSSARSIAGQIAGANNLPYAKADVVLDTVPTPVEIDRALARLEMKARDTGFAVGFATAQPATSCRLGEKSGRARDFPDADYNGGDQGEVVVTSFTARATTPE